MKNTSFLRSKFAQTAAAVVFLAAVFFVNTYQNTLHEDYRNSNFTKFWVASHMVLTGLNPYDATQWHDENLRLGMTWVPVEIFLYPLPMAFLFVPLALLPAQESFFVWNLISQTILALTCFALLNQLGAVGQKRLFLPLVILLLFFGPVYLSLHIGSIGAMVTAILVVSIFLLEKNRSLLAGLLLSILILKPSQGMAILFLIGIWFLIKRDWKAVLGMAAGGLILLISGLLFDPLWIQKFRDSSQALSDQTLGIHSNIYSFAYLGCNQNLPCMWAMGTLGTLLVLGFGIWYLWRNHARLTVWEAFNLIIPLGFVSTLYLWSYDQFPYILPIIWIAGTLVEKTKSYIATFVFLIVLDVVAFVALSVTAYTHRDLLSILTTLLVLGLCLWLRRSGVKPLSPTSAT